MISIILGQNRKETSIISFLEARYDGDIEELGRICADNFIFHNAPYVGLGLTTSWRNDSLFIIDINKNVSIDSSIRKNDIILEINGKSLLNSDFEQNPFQGPVGKKIQLLIQSGEQNKLIEYSGTLKRIAPTQNFDTFSKDVQNFSDMWEDYEIIIQDFFSDKNQVLIAYNWMGNKKGESLHYTFSVIEIYQLTAFSHKIISLKSQWSEKQLLDQIKATPK
ncbi:MAG: hypothetical protein HN657_02405 [Candidatus Marinimicrobia bacterium]|jgi:hypothetical protein|nr:hypothetical protein [Candidatus Neomarinimicrobiota bacterium]MBT3496391.1 hypothetical protein [Candidatus Neomarinimicrobiota bacterium]MBT3691783.1 hypothetical protein [Candidatus Neomarinimicrobiota bacterium]MBT3732168.1 hypothetical protein [Candidatus Neomarinimicrobiota bacterium]MBT4144352.1 hypothetical protein [Candidatus Neomarinimicrobiota bacterium]